MLQPRNINSNLQTPIHLTPLRDSILSPPLVQPCTNTFPIFGSDPTPRYILPLFPLQALCYTLSRSRDSLSSVTVLWTVGLRRVQPSVLFVIMIFRLPIRPRIPFPPYVSCFRSSFCFMFPFRIFRSILIRIFRSILFSIPDPEPRP